VEGRLALGIPDGAPLFAAKLWIVSDANVLVPDRIAYPAAIRVRLSAETAIVSPAIGAILPADRTDTVEVILAPRVAQSSILLLVRSARGDDLTDASTVGVLPAVAASCNRDSNEYYQYLVHLY